jgi:hypothetical protein
MAMKNFISWDIKPCIPIKVNRRSGRIYCLHLQDLRESQARNKYEAGRKQNSLGLLFFPKDGEVMLLRKVD